MKFPHVATLIASSVWLMSCGNEAASNDSTSQSPDVVHSITLSNGKDFNGWSHVCVENKPIEEVWSLIDGVIRCQGEPLGYLQTNESYQDFTLTFEWRWPAEPGNSGVLLRIASEPETFMPKCVEAQLKHQSAGDIWSFFGASLDTSGQRTRSIQGHESLGDFDGISHLKDNENPAGEWNQYEITLVGDTLIISINGETVNEATGLDVVSGPIGFQSEGAEIHFRNIQIIPL